MQQQWKTQDETKQAVFILTPEVLTLEPDVDCSFKNTSVYKANLTSP